jgi:hypothetical protein
MVVAFALGIAVEIFFGPGFRPKKLERKARPFGVMPKFNFMLVDENGYFYPL